MPFLITDDQFLKAEESQYDGFEKLWVETDQSVDRIAWQGASLIAIHFPNFADGRGFGLAKILRAQGYKGVLRAVGHLIPDQYPMARRVGFDEVEISDAQAQRQTASQWRAQIDWKSFDYQARLGQERAIK